MRETKIKTQDGEQKTTILPMQGNSCMACWNRELTADNGPLAPRAHGIVVSLPVHLKELDGSVCIVCYVARCMTCGHIRSYGAIPGIYKNPSMPDTNIQKWPEILRNNIDPMRFEEAIFDAPNRPIWLNAKDLQAAFETRERSAFYEPAYA